MFKCDSFARFNNDSICVETGEIQKSKEFYLKIINLEIANKEIKLKAQLRIQRDFSE